MFALTGRLPNLPALWSLWLLFHYHACCRRHRIGPARECICSLAYAGDADRNGNDSPQPFRHVRLDPLIVVIAVVAIVAVFAYERVFLSHWTGDEQHGHH